MPSIVSGILAFFLVIGAALRLRRLPATRLCGLCREPTFRVRGGVRDRAAGLLGLHRRWCPTCGWTGLRRERPTPRTPRVRPAHESGFRWARPEPGSAPVFRWAPEDADLPSGFRWREIRADG